MAWWFDRPLLKALTRGWGETARSEYFERIRDEQEEIPMSIMTSMQNIDAKATGLLTHVTMMIAALSLVATLLADHPVEEGIIIVEIAAYLVLAIGCLRCLNLFNLRRSARTEEELIAELRLRNTVAPRTLYSLCTRSDRPHRLYPHLAARDVFLVAANEIHPVLAERPLRDHGAARRDRRQAHHDRARGRERRGQGGAAQAVRHRRRHLGREASQRGPSQGLHGRHRRRQAHSSRVRRAQRAHRHEGRVLGGRHLHPRQEHHAAGRAPSAAWKAAACCARKPS